MVDTNQPAHGRRRCAGFLLGGWGMSGARRTVSQRGKYPLRANEGIWAGGPV
jgi:hypothetical protein